MTQGNDGTDSNAGAAAERQQESVAVATGEPNKKTCCCAKRKKSYFSKPKNWVSLGTLIAVGVYTGITLLIWCNSSEQLKISRDTEMRQLRAYVIFDSGRVSVEKGKYKVTAKVRNGGQTPAVNLTHFIDAVALPSNLVNPRDHPNLKLKETGPFSKDLLPNSSFDIADGRTDIPSDAVRKQVAAGGQLYVIGLVKYRDVFGHCQYSGFMSFTRDGELIVFQNPSTHVEGKPCNDQGKADYP